MSVQKGTDLYKDELRERREQLEPLARAAREAVDRAERWDRKWMRWSWRLALILSVAFLAIEIGRELVLAFGG